MKSRYINFLPSAAAGMTCEEWNLFCKYYTRIYGSNSSELDVFDILDKVHNMRKDNILEDTLLDEFELYCKDNNISVSEGLTDPHEWIRTFSRQLAERDRRTSSSTKET